MAEVGCKSLPMIVPTCEGHVNLMNFVGGTQGGRSLGYGHCVALATSRV